MKKKNTGKAVIGLKDIGQFLLAIGGALLIVSAMVVIFITLVGCNTFRVIQVDGEPSECNDFYTTMMFYAEQSKGKGQGDSAFVGTVYNECRTARAEDRAQLKEKHCRDLFYGTGNPIIKGETRESYERYSQYLECSKK